MKRKLFTALVVLMIGAALAGCGSKAQQSAQPAQEPAKQESAAVTIKPMPGAFDMENLKDCMPNVAFSVDDVDFELNCIYAMIYDVEYYDMVDIANLKVGDIIETADGDVTVKTIKDTESGKLINEDEADMLELQAPEESSGVFQIVGMDDVLGMRLLGQAQLSLSENVVLHDCTTEPGEVVDVQASELKEYLANLPEERKEFSQYATTILLEGELVTEITRNWRP